jgi:uncharacterized protein
VSVTPRQCKKRATEGRRDVATPGGYCAMEILHVPRGPHFDAHPRYDAASETLARATDQRPALFCRATQQSFLRLASTPALVRQYGAAGMTNDDALEALNRFLASPTVAYREEPTGLASLWHRLAGRKTASP